MQNTVYILQSHLTNLLQIKNTPKKSYNLFYDLRINGLLLVIRRHTTNKYFEIIFQVWTGFDQLSVKILFHFLFIVKTTDCIAFSKQCLLMIIYKVL